MSEKRYQKNCRKCNRTFTSKRSDAQFCSGKCRAKFSRDNKDKLIGSQAKEIEKHKAWKELADKKMKWLRERYNEIMGDDYNELIGDD